MSDTPNIPPLHPPVAPPIAPPISTFIPAPKPDLATTDVPCVSCGYSLRGLSETDACPECGVPVARSLMGNLLYLSNPALIESLCRGAQLIEWALVVLVLVLAVGLAAGISVAAGVVSKSAAGGKPAPPAAVFPVWVTIMLALISTAGRLMFYTGWWLLSEPDPAFVGQETGASHRRVLRVATGICVVFTVMEGLAQVGAPAMAITPRTAGSFGGFIVLTTIVWICSLAAWAVLYFSSMRYVRWLAPRLPDQWVFDRAKLLTWLGPVLYIFGCGIGQIIFGYGIGQIIALCMYWNLIVRILKHLTEIREKQREESAGSPALP